MGVGGQWQRNGFGDFVTLRFLIAVNSKSRVAIELYRRQEQKCRDLFRDHIMTMENWIVERRVKILHSYECIRFRGQGKFKNLLRA